MYENFGIDYILYFAWSANTPTFQQKCTRKESKKECTKMRYGINYPMAQNLKVHAWSVLTITPLGTNIVILEILAHLQQMYRKRGK